VATRLPYVRFPPEADLQFSSAAHVNDLTKSVTRLGPPLGRVSQAWFVLPLRTFIDNKNQRGCPMERPAIR
jgi:hypothetical protein